MPTAQVSASVPPSATYQMVQAAYGLSIGEILTKTTFGYQSTKNPELFIAIAFVESSPIFVQTASTMQKVNAVPTVLKTYQIGAQLTVLTPIYGLTLGDIVTKTETGSYQSTQNPQVFISADAVENNTNFQ